MKMKRIIQTLILAALLCLPLLHMAGVASAVCPGVTENSAQDQVLEGAGQAGADCSSNKIQNTVSSIVDILSIVVGIAAIIMILVSGFKYITSGGDSSKVSSAKQTLIYALVGVAVAALAQVLVSVTLSTATDAGKPPAAEKKDKKDK
jgi:hypothetical protein